MSPWPSEEGALEGPPVGAMDVLAKFGGKHGRRAAVAWSTYRALKPLYKKVRTWLDHRECYSLSVLGTDPIYEAVHAWVLKQLPAEDVRTVIVSTGDLRGPSTDQSGSLPNVRLRHAGSVPHKIVLDGESLLVSVTREELKGFTGVSGVGTWSRTFERMEFTAISPRGRDLLLAQIDALVEARKDSPGPPPILMPMRWGGDWRVRADLPRRSLESVILKDGQLERLVGDLRRFLDDEENYKRLDLPYHSGYLFHGPAGTGKTSVAKALANAFDLRVYYLPLADMDSDADLMALLAEVSPRSMLLLEDVDVYHAVTSRDDEHKVTLSAVLNSLDGLWTPSGLITVMTTNNRAALDPALVRAGRVDVEEFFDVLDLSQAQRVEQWLTGSTTSLAARYVGEPPSSLVGEVVKQRNGVPKLVG